MGFPHIFKMAVAIYCSCLNNIIHNALNVWYISAVG